TPVFAARAGSVYTVVEGARLASLDERSARRLAGTGAAGACGPASRARGCVLRAGVRARRDRPVATADPALLAGRRRPPAHLRPGRHRRAAAQAPERGDLPPAADRAQSPDHALAAASRWRTRLRRLVPAASR